MSDFINYSLRCVDMGLDLRDANDSVGEGKWTILHNVRDFQEGSIRTRLGRSTVANSPSGSTAINTIKYLGGYYYLVQNSTNIYQIPAAIGGAQTLLYGNLGLSAGENTHTIIPYHGTLENTSNNGAVRGFISNWGSGGSTGMRSWKPGDAATTGWGVIGSGLTPTVADNGVGTLDSSIGINYQWKWTYYNSNNGAESMPSPPTVATAFVNRQVNVAVTASIEAQTTNIRLYRTGGSLAEYHLVATAANATGNIADNVSDITAALANTIPTQNLIPAAPQFTSHVVFSFSDPSDHAWGPLNNLFFFGDKAATNKGVLYYTSPLTIFGVGQDNFVNVTTPDEPLLNGFLYGENGYVFTEKDLYGIRVSGDVLAPRVTVYKTPVGKGLVHPNAFCIGLYVYFMAEDGIYKTDCQSPAVRISTALDPLFRTETVGVTSGFYDGITTGGNTTATMTYHRGEIHLWVADSVSYIQYIYNEEYDRWRSARGAAGAYAKSSYSNEAPGSTAHYYACINGTVQGDSTGTTDPASAAISARVRTGSINFGSPSTLKRIGNVIIDANTHGNTVTMTPFFNGESSSGSTGTFSGAGRALYPLSISDTECFSFAVDLTWSGDVEIFSITIQYHLEEEVVTHWFSDETTHGLSGVQKVKDVLLALVSSASGTLTVKTVGVDGVVVTKTYSVPSTGGVYKKVGIFLDPTFGYLYSYAFDSASGFRLYGSECEVRVKPWKTNEGYQLVSPFEGEA